MERGGRSRVDGAMEEVNGMHRQLEEMARERDDSRRDAEEKGERLREARADLEGARRRLTEAATEAEGARSEAAKAEAARLGLFGRGGLPLTGLGLRSQLLELLVFVVVISQPGLESLGRN